LPLSFDTSKIEMKDMVVVWFAYTLVTLTVVLSKSKL
jgi:hypothetical protein